MGPGSIGSTLVTRLLAEDWADRVVVLDNLSSGSSEVDGERDGRSMSRRSTFRFAVFGLVAGLLLGALVYLPRVNGYQSVVPQNDSSQLETVGRPVTGGDG